MACVCGSLVSGVMSHGGLENETTLGKGLCLWQSAGKDCLFMNQAQCIPSTIDLTTQRLIMRDKFPLGDLSVTCTGINQCKYCLLLDLASWGISEPLTNSNKTMGYHRLPKLTMIACEATEIMLQS